MKQKKPGKSLKPHLVEISESSLIDDLKDSQFAAQYLEAVLQDGSNAAFLFAIRNVVKAQGGMTRLAHETKLGRESLYKTLSRTGNPQFATVVSILDHLGLRVSIDAQTTKRKRSA